MKDYASMSDFEINYGVALSLGLDVKYYQERSGNMVWFSVKNDNGNDYFDYIDYKDFCNNPADAWPIITENRIGIIPAQDAGKWKSAHREVGEDDTPHHFTQSDKPLRAAMIVFLMMKESEND